MQDYVIVTDTSANLPEDLIDKFGFKILSFSFFFDLVEYLSYEKGKKTDLTKFYDMMRNKDEVKTSLVSPEQFAAVFEDCVKEGKDVLYIGFTSGLSGTYQSSKIAAEIVMEKYPERKIVVWDSLCAALGQGLMAYKAGEMYQAGKSMEEVLNMLEDKKLKMCHWFTVDDLFFLSRGGRLSTTTAMFGSLLNIKPVLHVDDNGKLVSMSKVRGRKQSLVALAEKFDELQIEGENDVIAISHGDCIEDAEFIIAELKKKHKFKDIIVNCLDPVIGAHSGPGTAAIFFIGQHR